MYSVILPLYNKEKSILKTIDSILNQTFTEFEVIVINDGSTDRSLEMLASKVDKRLKIYTKKNGGVSSARNYGILKASYDLIAFIDGDDLWDKDYLKQMNELVCLYPECSIYGSAWCRMENDKIVEENFGLEKDKSYKIENYFEQAVIHTLLWTSATIVKKNTLIESGMFDCNLSMGEDMDLWIRLNMKYKLGFLNKILAFYIQDAENRACVTGLKPLNQNILSRLIDYKPAEMQDKYLKLYLDTFRVRQCIPYFFTIENKNEVFHILQHVDFSIRPFYWRIIYAKFAWGLKRRIYQYYKKIK
jgi:glycosyltransferase involved in cell wall biosynthesis